MNTTHIWDKFADNVLHFIQKRIERPEDALDVRQEVFMKIHLKSTQLQDTDKMLSWIYQITRNSIHDYYRHQYKVNQEQEIWAKQIPQKEENTLEQQEIFCCLIPFLEKLPPKYKIVMLLHHQEGLKQNQIAEKLNISVSGVKSRIQRAREILKSQFTVCCGYHLGKDGYLHGEQDCEICNHVH